jgi:hypothetical protein
MTESTGLTVEPTRETKTSRARTFGVTETFMGLIGYSFSDILETRSPDMTNPTKNLKDCMSTAK